MSPTSLCIWHLTRADTSPVRRSLSMADSPCTIRRGPIVFRSNRCRQTEIRSEAAETSRTWGLLCHEHIIDVQGVLILLIEDDLSVSHTQKNEVDVAVEPISIRHREFAFGLERNLIAVADDIDQTKAEASVCVFTISKELSEEGQSRTLSCWTAGTGMFRPCSSSDWNGRNCVTPSGTTAT